MKKSRRVLGLELRRNDQGQTKDLGVIGTYTVTEATRMDKTDEVVH